MSSCESLNGNGNGDGMKPLQRSVFFLHIEVQSTVNITRADQESGRALLIQLDCFSLLLD